MDDPSRYAPPRGGAPRPEDETTDTYKRLREQYRERHHNDWMGGGGGGEAGRR